jgi:quercetin dioxygenase-like cupin family protein
MTRGTWREARTQGASICHIGATEDAASRRVTTVRRPGSLPGRAHRVHHVGRIAETAADTGAYAPHSEGYARFPLVDRAAGSVHQALTVCELTPGGHVVVHQHAFEEGLYVLSGELGLGVAGVSEDLGADDYVFVERGVPHSLTNQASDTVRWLEVSAPQPGAALEDTVFPAGDPPIPEVEPRYRRAGFDASQLPPPSSAIGLAGFGAANVGGASLKVLIEREFGASQFNLMVVEYVEGGLIKEHDHPFEEAFFFVSGEIEAVLDGQTYTLRAGDYCWSGVGSMHAFTNRSPEPVRWLETQVPQPPARHQARFKSEWERLLG